MKPLREARREFMREYLEGVLREAKGNRSRAAEIAGIHRSHLQRKLLDYGLNRPVPQKGRRGNFGVMHA